MEFQESVELLYPCWCKLFTSNSCKLYTTNRGVATSRIEPDPNDALADPKWWEFSLKAANSKIWMASVLNILTLGDALRMVTYLGSRKKICMKYKNNVYTYIYILIPQKANVRNVKLAVRDFLQRLLYTGGLGRTAGVFDGVVIKECLVGLLFPFVLWNCALTILSRNHPILFETCFQDSIFKKILKKNIWEIGYLSPQRICWFVGLSHCNFQNTVHARLALFDRFRDDLWRNLVSSAVLVPSIF